MKAPRSRRKNTGVWERTISRYLHAHRVPLTWQAQGRGFTGIAGFTFRRIVPKSRSGDISAVTWSKMPEYMRKHQHDPNLIVFVTNAHYGDSIEDVIVVMRLGTLAPMLASHIDTDRERWIDNAS